MPARLGAAAIIVAIAHCASADIILLEQSRDLLVRAEDPSSPFVEGRRSSSIAGAFVDSVSVLAGAHSGGASMDSFIGGHGVRAGALVEGLGDLGFPMGQGMGEATLSARFEVVNPTTFRLSGLLEANGSDAGGGMTLTGPAGAVFELVAYSGAPSVEYFDQTGTLDPGLYELVASVGASVFSPPGANARFDLVLELPAPGATVVLAAGLALAARRRR
jgi:hypothetical protein